MSRTLRIAVLSLLAIVTTAQVRPTEFFTIPAEKAYHLKPGENGKWRSGHFEVSCAGADDLYLATGATAYTGKPGDGECKSTTLYVTNNSGYPMLIENGGSGSPHAVAPHRTLIDDSVVIYQGKNPPNVSLVVFAMWWEPREATYPQRVSPQSLSQSTGTSSGAASPPLSMRPQAKSTGRPTAAAPQPSPLHPKVAARDGCAPGKPCAVNANIVPVNGASPGVPVAPAKPSIRFTAQPVVAVATLAPTPAFTVRLAGDCLMGSFGPFSAQCAQASATSVPPTSAPATTSVKPIAAQFGPPQIARNAPQAASSASAFGPRLPTPIPVATAPPRPIFTPPPPVQQRTPTPNSRPSSSVAERERDPGCFSVPPGFDEAEEAAVAVSDHGFYYTNRCGKPIVITMLDTILTDDHYVDVNIVVAGGAGYTAPKDTYPTHWHFVSP